MAAIDSEFKPVCAVHVRSASVFECMQVMQQTVRHQRVFGPMLQSNLHLTNVVHAQRLPLRECSMQALVEGHFAFGNADALTARWLRHGDGKIA